MKKILAGLIGLCTLISLIPLSYALNEETSKSSEYELVTVDETEIYKGLGEIYPRSSTKLKSFSFKLTNSLEDPAYTLKSLNYRCSDDFFESLELELTDEKIVEATASRSENFTNYTFQNINHRFHVNNIPFSLYAKGKYKTGRKIGICNINQILVTGENENELRLNREIENNIFMAIQAITFWGNGRNNLVSVTSYTTSKKYLVENTNNTEILSYNFESNEDNTTLDEVILVCSGKEIPISNVGLKLDQAEFTPSQVFENTDKLDPTSESNTSTRTSKQYYFTNLNQPISNAKSLNASLTADLGKFSSSSNDSLYNQSINCHLAKVKILRADGSYESEISGSNNLLLGPPSNLKGASDVSPENPNYEAIEYLIKKGIINGYPDGTFHPYQKINRAEVAKIIAEAQISKIPNATQNCFPDTNQEAWYNKYTCAMKNKGWINGDGITGNFNPSHSINQIESLKITLESLEISLEKSPYMKGISPLDEDSTWKKKYLLKGLELGLVGRRYVYHNTLWGKHVMTREQFASMLYKAITYEGSLEIQKEFHETLLTLSQNNPQNENTLTLDCELEYYSQLDRAIKLSENIFARPDYTYYPSADIISREISINGSITQFEPDELGIQTAIISQCPKIVSSYLNQSYLHKRNQENQDFVQTATRYQSFEALKTLVNEGGNPLYIPDSYYQPPLYNFVLNSGNTEIETAKSFINYFLSQGGDINYFVGSKSILDSAHNENIRDYLISKGAKTSQELQAELESATN